MTELLCKEEVYSIIGAAMEVYSDISRRSAITQLPEGNRDAGRRARQLWLCQQAGMETQGLDKAIHELRE